MRFMSLVTPPYSPHRPPRKTARSPYSEVLAPQRGSEVAASKLVMMRLHIGNRIRSGVLADALRKVTLEAVRTRWPLSGDPPGRAPN